MPLPTTTLALGCTSAELDLSSCRSQSPQEASEVEAIDVNNRHDIEAVKMAKTLRHTTSENSYFEPPAAGRRSKTPSQYAPMMSSFSLPLVDYGVKPLSR